MVWRGGGCFVFWGVFYKFHAGERERIAKNENEVHCIWNIFSLSPFHSSPSQREVWILFLFLGGLRSVAGPAPASVTRSKSQRVSVMAALGLTDPPGKRGVGCMCRVTVLPVPNAFPEVCFHYLELAQVLVSAEPGAGVQPLEKAPAPRLGSRGWGWNRPAGGAAAAQPRLSGHYGCRSSI